MPNERVSDGQAASPRARAAAERLAQRLAGPAPLLLGHSSAARDLRRQIQAAIESSSAVLLVGAPGTGKRTVAEIIHHFAGGETPSLARVCTDVPGPIDPPEGFAFVSPIEQLSLDQQAKLRRDVGLSRLLLGTRLDPDSRDGQARLSPELLRWCSIRIDLPSLVERIDDLEALVIGLLHRVPTTRPVGAISDDALGCLRTHDWPGNVSELEDVITEALEVGTTTQIELHDLPAALRERDPRGSKLSAPEQEFALALAERRAVQRVMRLVRGNKRRAARLLQIGKTTLYRRLREYDSSSA